ESEKAEVEIEAPASGVLRHVYVPEGETVPSGTLLAAITATVEEPFDVRAFREQHDRPAAAPAAARLLPAAETPLSPARRGTAAPITPAARALARELHVDPARIPGTGPGGRVTREDVEAWAARRRDLVPVAEGAAWRARRAPRRSPVWCCPGCSRRSTWRTRAAGSGRCAASPRRRRACRRARSCARPPGCGAGREAAAPTSRTSPCRRSSSSRE